jgi:hypothetical protein
MNIPNFTIGDKNREAFCLLIKALPTGKLYTAKVIEKELHRSNEQNSLYWEFVTGLGNQIGYSKDEMHQLLGYKFLRYEKDGHDFIKSTTKLTTKEFSEYFEQCERFGAELGFILEAL